MSNQNKSLYKKLIPIFGTKPLLPIIPPDANLTKNSKLDENNLGKIPGLFSRGNPPTWCGFGGWSNTNAEQVDIDEWSAWMDHSVGVQTKEHPCIDIDIDDPELADEVNQVLDKHLPPTTTRSRPNTPRTVRVFKLADGKEPIKKSRIVFGNGMGAVEFLGDGQFFVAEGLHPSGDYQSLNNTPIATITPEQLNAVQEVLREHFGDILEKGKPRLSKTNSPRVRLEIGERSYQTMVDTITYWRSDSGRWDALRDLIWGWTNDSSQTHAEVNAKLIMNSVKNKDERWGRYYNDIPVLVEGAVKRLNNQEYSLEKALKLLTPKKEKLDEIDLDKLPVLLKKSVFTLSNAIKIDPVVHTTMLLCYMGISLGKRFKIYEKSSHVILPNLSFMVGGVSGERKSGAINPLDESILRKIKHIALDKHKRKMVKAKAHNNSIKTRIDNCSKQLLETDIGSPEYENKLAEIECLEIQRIKVTDKPVIYMSDATSETALKEQINHGQVLFRTADAEKFIDIITGKYTGGKVDIGTYLNMLSNDWVEQSRITTGSHDGGMGCMGLYGMTQHDNNMRLFTNQKFRQSGFLSRIFFVRAKFTDKTEYESDPVLDEFTINNLSNVMVKAYSVDNCTVELGSEATIMRREFFNKWEKLQHPDGKHWDNRELVNKITSNAVRLATVVYFLEHYDEIESDKAYFIDKKSMEIGIYLADLFMAGNLSYIKNEVDNQLADLMRKILIYVVKSDMDSFTPSFLQNNVASDKEIRTKIKDIIDIFINEGIFDVKETNRNSIKVSLTVLGEQLCEEIGVNKEI